MAPELVEAIHAMRKSLAAFCLVLDPLSGALVALHAPHQVGRHLAFLLMIPCFALAASLDLAAALGPSEIS